MVLFLRVLHYAGFFPPVVFTLYSIVYTTVSDVIIQSRSFGLLIFEADVLILEAAILPATLLKYWITSASV